MINRCDSTIPPRELEPRTKEWEKQEEKSKSKKKKKKKKEKLKTKTMWSYSVKLGKNTLWTFECCQEMEHFARDHFIVCNESTRRTECWLCSIFYNFFFWVRKSEIGENRFISEKIYHLMTWQGSIAALNKQIYFNRLDHSLITLPIIIQRNQ